MIFSGLISRCTIPAECAAASAAATWPERSRSLLRGSGPRRSEFAQRFAFDQFGDDVGQAVLFADIVDVKNVGVIEGAGGAGLLLKARAAAGVGGHLRRQNLQRDRAVEARIAGAIHLAHAADAKQGLNLVRTELRSRGKHCEGSPLLLRKQNRKRFFELNMQRALCPHSETIFISCFAPYFSFTNLANASPRARRVGPCAIAGQELSNPPRGRISISPSR